MTRLEALRALREAVKAGEPSGDFFGIKITKSPAIPPGYVAMVTEAEAVFLTPDGRVVALADFIAQAEAQDGPKSTEGTSK